MSTRARILYLYAVLVILYGVTAFIFPPSTSELKHYGISSASLRLIDVAIIIPYVLIWLAGFYAYIGLKEYAQPLKRTKDGKLMNRLAHGVLLLALWLPISAILGGFFNYIEQGHPGATPAFTVIANYVGLLLPLTGFALIGLAARGLCNLAKIRLSTRTNNILALIIIVLGVLYTDMVAGNSLVKPYGSFSHLPHLLVLLTFVVPYIYMWCIGLVSALRLYLYRKRAPGIVYRKSWGLLAFGIGAIIILLIFVEFVSTLVSQLNSLSIGGALIAVYILLVLLAVGYVLTFRGAKRLQKIEEA